MIYPSFSLRCIGFVFGVTTLAACSAQTPTLTVPADWKSDCAGRMQLSFPGEVDFPSTPGKRFESLMGLTQSTASPPSFTYEDGTQSGYTSINYRGNPLISESLNADILEKIFLAHSKQRLLRGQKDYATRVAPDGNQYGFQVIKTNNSQISAWNFYGNRFAVVVRYGDRIFSTNYDSFHTNNQDIKSELEIFAKSITNRKSFEIPTQTGVCLPSTFVGDDGKQFRNISIAYRLKDHPDVQIVLKDASAANTEPGIRTQNAEPLPVIQSLWDQHLTIFAKDAKNEWARGGHPVTLAGYKGLSSFVKFIRHDDTVDYGYAAVVRGDPNAKDDTPDLMVYVIRDSQNAKGKEPMPKDEFLKMAETIAASVKRRPVQ